MARSLGDHVCKRVGVISTPEVKSFDVTAEDAILVLASDGVWEFISNEEAISIVAKHPNAQEGCVASLINEATLTPTLTLTLTLSLTLSLTLALALTLTLTSCVALIKESTERWRKEEGTYRDDITAIVVHLPLALQVRSSRQLRE